MRSAVAGPASSNRTSGARSARVPYRLGEIRWGMLLASAAAVVAYNWSTSEEISRLAATEPLLDPSAREMAASFAFYFSLLLNVGTFLLITWVASLGGRLLAGRFPKGRTRVLLPPVVQIVAQAVVLIFILVRYTAT
jgi:hypothetical protein